ncbi:Uncharacterised protein [Bordetella pertussis]|nr:Uncharacterised protein [Bordetella pertussis]CFL82549.1 Uncharacterised protein [Bordetella pertussis]CFL90559.1 Uncharacterised protein [Bordetella pertussis]CFM00072.1 Uncharacterised protein [Bordetella pertussis]CFM14145.1 Uncharacterised protein [Bordetella pertussis]
MPSPVDSVGSSCPSQAAVIARSTRTLVPTPLALPSTERLWRDTHSNRRCVSRSSQALNRPRKCPTVMICDCCQCV